MGLIEVQRGTQDLKPTSNYDAWRIEIKEKINHLSWEEKAKYFLQWALLSPTAHNKQGIEVEIDNGRKSLQIWPKESDIGTPSDRLGRQTYIGLGTFATNLEIAMSSYQQEFKVEFRQKIKNGKNIFGMQYEIAETTTSLQSANTLSNILARRSYRGKFIPNTPINQETLDEMTRLATVQSVKLSVFSDRWTILAIAELQYIADRFVLLKDEFRHDLADHLVTNDSDLTRVMPGATFGLSDDSALKVHNALKEHGQFDGDFASGFATSDRDAIASSPLVGMISVSNDIPQEWINAGKAFEQIWLLAQSKGLGVGVMAAMVESEMHNLSLKVRLGLLRERPTIVFRCGFPIEQFPHSPRIPLSELIVKS